MRIEKKDSSDERRILTAMIVNRVVLARIASKWNGRLFRSRWANLVAGWCIRHLKRYDSAPGELIESAYEEWSATTADKTTVNLVGDFLESISAEYEDLNREINSEYIIDVASDHFNLVAAERLAENIQDDVSARDLSALHQRVNAWSKIELGSGDGIDVLHEIEVVREAFESKSEPLITYPGALGQFFGDSLERDGFIGIEGPDKRGKSFWLMDMAYRALLQRRRIAFFEAGDMSQNQIMRRLMTRIAHHPQKSCSIQYPIKIARNQGDHVATVEYKTRRYDRPLSWRRAWRKTKQLVTHRLKTDRVLFRLSCHPNSSISIGGIRSILSDWERQEWVPDVIVIDYADILKSDIPQAERRQQIDDTWRQMRAMSQALHCLVVTASQTDAAAYTSHTIGRQNFSDSKTKLAHVTGMVGLNQSYKEKELGIIRLNWVVRREGLYSETKCVHVAGALAIGNPAIRSTW